MVKSEAELIRDLGDRLAKINGLGEGNLEAESTDSSPQNDNILIASNPYGTSYADTLDGEE